jgi:hypothetical protein
MLTVCWLVLTLLSGGDPIHVRADAIVDVKRIPYPPGSHLRLLGGHETMVREPPDRVLELIAACKP